MGWGCRIHRLHHCRSVRLPSSANQSPGYDNSDAEVPVPVLWRTESSPILRSTLTRSSRTSLGPIYELNKTVSSFTFKHITIYIYHHHHVAPSARISLTVSRHFSLSLIASGRSSGLQPVSSHSCCM